MKKPDEIKKALEICTGCGGCKNCPYPDDECFGDTVMRDALAYIQQLEAAHLKWISVEDRLPAGKVLAANFAPGTCDYNEYIIGYVSGEKCYATNDHEILYDVTHWMPLPPKEDVKNE